MYSEKKIRLVLYLNQLKAGFKACFFILIYLGSISYCAQNFTPNELDSLKRSLATSKNDTSKLKALNLISYEIKYNDKDGSAKYANEAITLAAKLKMPGEAAKAFKTLGILADEAGNVDQCIRFYMQAIENFNKINDTIGVARTEGNIGMLYRKLGRSKESMEYFLRCLPIFIKTNFAPGINIASQNIGIVYYDLRKFDSALKYFQIAERVVEKNGLSDPSIYGNLSNCYSELHQPDKEQVYLEKCIQKFEQKNDSSRNFYHWRFILGRLYSLRGDQKKGLQLMLETVAHYRIHNEIRTKNGLDLLRMYSETMFSLHKPNEAYAILKEYVHIKDSLFQSSFTAQLNELSKKYDSEKKELSIRNLEKEQEIKSAKIEQQSILQVALVIGLALAFFVLFLLFKNLSQKKKDNHIIQHQKDIVELKNREIIDSITYAKRIQQALIPNEKLFEKQLNSVRGKTTKELENL